MRRWLLRSVLLTVVALGTHVLLRGQARQPSDQKPLAFEVATIKRNVSLAEGGSIGMEPGGRFRAVNADLRFMIATMYRTGPRLFASQIIGLPDWATTEHWDITAKVTDDLAGRPPQELFRQMPPMVQSLLEDRFKLRLHRDTQPQPTYALLVAREGTLGPQFRRTAADCLTDFAKCQIQSTPGRYTGVGVTIPTLMILLSNAVERVIVDRTGLTGSFDLDLEWAADATSDKPSIFTALQEQLGLKLEFQRNPVDVVIIDHVERPTPD